jgi:hypothetical protein
LSPPRCRASIGAFIAQEFGLIYESRSGLIALLHRLDLEYHKPNVIPRKLDEDKQKAFIEDYNKTLNSLGNDEVELSLMRSIRPMRRGVANRRACPIWCDVVRDIRLGAGKRKASSLAVRKLF